MSVLSVEPMTPPRTDASPIFEFFRGVYATELLTAAVAHFDLFGLLAKAPLDAGSLGAALGLDSRPVVVLTTALRAMGLLRQDPDGRLAPTELALEHLAPGVPFDVSGYIALASGSPGVREMVERLRSNQHGILSQAGTGAAFIFREGIDSAMEREGSARELTLALAGRARNVAPVLAAKYPLPRARMLLDVGGGNGLYSVAYLRAHPELRAIVWDRPEVVKVAEEFAVEYGVKDRLECLAGDMFAEEVPPSDTILLSNVLHDWDVPEASALTGRLAHAVPPDGQLLIHDVFLDDDLGGPLAIALYSAALFTITEGRAYSAAEYRAWLEKGGLVPGPIVPTAIHLGVLPATPRA
jgi:hypothetical protein